MNPGVPDFEGPLAPASTSLDPLVPRRSADRAPELRLAALADECADIVRRWTMLSERHARAVTRFETQIAEWSDGNARAQQDTAERLAALERLVREEWRELRVLHEEPIRQLGEHATSLTQVCIATANVAQQGFERSEARLTAIEQELHRRLTDVTRELQAAAADLRSAQTALVRPGDVAQTWSLDGVTRLHQQLREGQTSPLGAHTAVTAGVTALPALDQPADSAGALVTRVDSIEQRLADREATRDETTRATRAWWVAAAGVALVAAVVIGLIVAGAVRRGMREADARAARAEAAQKAAAAQAAEAVTAVREEATRQVADAQARAERAQLVSDVLAAGDLARFGLVGRRPFGGASAQVLWSPSRGMVFSGSGLPAAPAGTTYQVWLLTRGGAASAGTFAPDARGAVTHAITPQELPAPAYAALVTLEQGSGSTSPQGDVVLVRVRPPAPPAPTP